MGATGRAEVCVGTSKRIEIKSKTATRWAVQHSGIRGGLGDDMRVSRTRTIMFMFALAITMLAAGTGTPGCGNPEAGSVKVDPRLRERLGKGPETPPSAGGKARPEPPGIKSVLRKRAEPK